MDFLLQGWQWPSFHSFTHLSYPTSTPPHPDSFPDSNYYNPGRNDIFLIVTCILVMAILRDALRLGVFEPFARWKLMRDLKRRLLAPPKKAYTNGHASNGNGHHITNGNGIANGNGATNGTTARKPTTKQIKQVERSVMRFAEQGWSVVYYTFSWSYGLYVHNHLPTKVWNPTAVWVGYPHIPLAGPVKFYYLVQTACYLHQTLILNAEARRKDHWQMMAHHFVTVALLVTSYFTNFSRVGCLIMMLMDCCDIFLPLAKMVRYIDVSQLATDVLFGVFMVSWFITRHVLFVFVILSTMFESNTYIPRIIDHERGMYMDDRAYVGFVTLLWALQALQVVWFGMIVRVAYRVVTGSGAADERSDEEVDSDDIRKDD
ncbi:longevity-assurance protein [Coprinopsis sp. MPI-PUGE-AT-0042]|nr:longevity-assurance protein [Coprinopsis sp. MPI-PUGE-AT-0042]